MGNDRLLFPYRASYHGALLAKRFISQDDVPCKIRYPAAGCGVSDPRGIRQISMPAWIFSSLPAGMKIPRPLCKKDEGLRSLYHLLHHTARRAPACGADCQENMASRNGGIPAQPTWKVCVHGGRIHITMIHAVRTRLHSPFSLRLRSDLPHPLLAPVFHPHRLAVPFV